MYKHISTSISRFSKRDLWHNAYLDRISMFSICCIDVGYPVYTRLRYRQTRWFAVSLPAQLLVRRAGGLCTKPICILCDNAFHHIHMSASVIDARNLADRFSITTRYAYNFAYFCLVEIIFFTFVWFCPQTWLQLSDTIREMGRFTRALNPEYPG